MKRMSDSLNAPELPIAVVPGTGIDDGPAHLPIRIVGIPPARLEVSDDDFQAKKQATDNGHLAHVGVTASHLPGTVGDDNDRDDVEKLCDHPESFGHRTVERSGLSQQHVHVASIAYLSKSFVHDNLVVLSF